MFDQQKLTDLIAQEAALAKEVGDLSDSLRNQHASDKITSSPDLQAKYQRDTLRHATVDRDLRRVRAEREAMELLEPRRIKAKWDSPFSRFIRGGVDALSEEEQEAHVREETDLPVPDGGGPVFRVLPQHREAVATASDDASGQEAVQEEIPPRVIDRLAHYGGVSRMVQQFMTSTGGDYRCLQMDAASQEGELLATQGTEVDDEDLPPIKTINFGALTASSKSIRVTMEMIQDAVFDIQSYIERQSVRRLGRLWNRVFTTTQVAGGAIIGPRGVLTSAKAGITAAGQTAITWPEATNLIYEIDRAYREPDGEEGEGGFNPEMGGTTGYMISDGMEKALRVLLDGDNRPLWVPSTREGLPAMFNAYPLTVNGHMADPAANAIPMLFGNFSYFGIRTVAALSIYRFADSRAMRHHAVDFLAFSRRDSRVLGAEVDERRGGADVKVCEAIVSLKMAA